MSEQTSDRDIQSSQLTLGKTVCSENVPDIVVDGVHGVVVHAGAVRINLYTHRVDPDQNTLHRVIVGRLVVPVGQFATIADRFTRLAEKLAPAA